MRTPIAGLVGKYRGVKNEVDNKLDAIQGRLAWMYSMEMLL